MSVHPTYFDLATPLHKSPSVDRSLGCRGNIAIWVVASWIGLNLVQHLVIPYVLGREKLTVIYLWLRALVMTYARNA